MFMDEKYILHSMTYFEFDAEQASNYWYKSCEILVTTGLLLDT